MLVTQLKARWDKLIEDSHTIKIDRQDQNDRLFLEIVAAYTEPHRFYHNLSHLEHLFQELDSHKSVSDPVDFVSNGMLWAVWYHDFVYKAGAKTNEKKSAESALNVMRHLEIDESTIDKTFRLIMATKTHQCEPDEHETQIFLDADMAILGSDEATYLKYRQAVRREYSVFPDCLFNRGRKQFLLTTINQESIFVSDVFNGKYEKLARYNIERELSQLN